MVDAEDDRRDGVHEAAEHAHHDRAGDAGPGAVVVAEVAGTPGAEDHHALEADVDDAGPLRPEAAETGEHDRDDGDQGRGDRAARDQVVGAGDLLQQREPEQQPEERGGEPPARQAAARCFGAAAGSTTPVAVAGTLMP